MFKNNKRIMLSFLFAFVIFNSCASIQLKEYQPPADEKFKNIDPENQIYFLSEAITDQNEVLDIFGVDLIQQNIIPVYISLKNRGESSVLFNKETIEIKGSTNKETGLTSEIDVGNRGEKLYKANVMMGVSLLLAPITNKELADQEIREHNYKTRELGSATLNKNDQVSGFIYLQNIAVGSTSKVSLCFELHNLIDNKKIKYSSDINL